MRIFVAILSLVALSCASTTPPGYLTAEESESLSRTYEAMADKWAGGMEHYSAVGCTQHGVCFIIMSDGEPVKLLCADDLCEPIGDYCDSE